MSKQKKKPKLISYVTLATIMYIFGSFDKNKDVDGVVKKIKEKYDLKSITESINKIENRLKEKERVDV